MIIFMQNFIRLVQKQFQVSDEFGNKQAVLEIVNTLVSSVVICTCCAAIVQVIVCYKNCGHGWRKQLAPWWRYYRGCATTFQSEIGQKIYKYLNIRYTMYIIYTMFRWVRPCFQNPSFENEIFGGVLASAATCSRSLGFFFFSHHVSKIWGFTKINWSIEDYVVVWGKCSSNKLGHVWWSLGILNST